MTKNIPLTYFKLDTLELLNTASLSQEVDSYINQRNIQ